MFTLNTLNRRDEKQNKVVEGVCAEKESGTEKREKSKKVRWGEGGREGGGGRGS